MFFNQPILMLCLFTHVLSSALVQCFVAISMYYVLLLLWYWTFTITTSNNYNTIILSLAVSKIGYLLKMSSVL